MLSSGITPLRSGVTPLCGGITSLGSSITTLGSGITPLDSGITPLDSGITTPDSGITPLDSGITTPDSGITPPDGGITALGGGMMPLRCVVLPRRFGATARAPGKMPAGFPTLKSAHGPSLRRLPQPQQLDDLRPGVPWQDELEKSILETPAAAVFVGNHGMGPWQKPEVRACLSQMVEKSRPVIPVLLPGAPDKPEIGLFLRENTWVDLRQGITEDGLDRLLWGITGKKPDRRPPAQPSGPPLHNLPFPSLGPLFTGRDEALKNLEESLARPGGAAAIVQSEAIHGLGGIGKTRLAVEHAWRCGHRYTAAWFVQSDSSESLRRNLAALAGPALLHLPEWQQSEDEAVGAVLRWLREHPG